MGTPNKQQITIARLPFAQSHASIERVSRGNISIGTKVSFQFELRGISSLGLPTHPISPNVGLDIINSLDIKS